MRKSEKKEGGKLNLEGVFSGGIEVDLWLICG